MKLYLKIFGKVEWFRFHKATFYKYENAQSICWLRFFYDGRKGFLDLDFIYFDLLMRVKVSIF